MKTKRKTSKELKNKKKTISILKREEESVGFWDKYCQVYKWQIDENEMK